MKAIAHCSHFNFSLFLQLWRRNLFALNWMSWRRDATTGCRCHYFNTGKKKKKKGQPEKDVASEHFTSCNMLLC